MKLLSLIVGFLFFFIIFSTKHAHAVVDPLATENNYVGIHLLFPEEIHQASDLINSNGGDWGYVIVPIQITDRDLDKWQNFMNEAARLHVIPILRIATEPYYANTNVWRRPSDYDIMDQANFLNSLTWPTKNRYIVVFNEMNRFDEWSGTSPSPEEYAEVLSYTFDIFKKRSRDFYIIMGGLDNGAPTDGKHLNSYQYLQRMYAKDPEIFNKIDGFSSHSYPNPGFSAPPNEGQMSVATYRHEYDYIKARANHPRPAFITETGWDSAKLGEDKVAQYYQQTFDTIWGKDRDKVVAITPFLLNAVGGAFDKFSFMKGGGPTKFYTTVKALPKTKGKPIFPTRRPQILGVERKAIIEKDFQNSYKSPDPFAASRILKLYTKVVFGGNVMKEMW